VERCKALWSVARRCGALQGVVSGFAPFPSIPLSSHPLQPRSMAIGENESNTSTTFVATPPSASAPLDDLPPSKTYDSAQDLCDDNQANQYAVSQETAGNLSIPQPNCCVIRSTTAALVAINLLLATAVLVWLLVYDMSDIAVALVSVVMALGIITGALVLFRPRRAFVLLRAAALILSAILLFIVIMLAVFSSKDFGVVSGLMVLGSLAIIGSMLSAACTCCVCMTMLSAEYSATTA
jgi:hypothetical protein